MNEKNMTFPITGIIKGVPQFIATGFFIDLYGGFVTAKHVLNKADIDEGTDFIIIQNLNNGYFLPRKVSNIFSHPNADISIGKPNNLLVKDMILENLAWAYDFELPIIGEKIFTIAYPLSRCLSESDNKWRFKTSILKGKIISIYDRCPSCNIETMCFQTNMNLLSGASGGPVFNSKGKVIGVNSWSYEIGTGEEPISFVTPLFYLKDVPVKNGKEMIKFRDLLKLQL